MAADTIHEALVDRNPLVLAEYPKHLDAEYGQYFKVARLFARIIGRPALMRELTRVGMHSRTLMEWVLIIMANLLRPDELGPAEAAYKAAVALAHLAPDAEPRRPCPAGRPLSDRKCATSAALGSAGAASTQATGNGVPSGLDHERQQSAGRRCRIRRAHPATAGQTMIGPRRPAAAGDRSGTAGWGSTPRRSDRNARSGMPARRPRRRTPGAGAERAAPARWSTPRQSSDGRLSRSLRRPAAPRCPPDRDGAVARPSPEPPQADALPPDVVERANQKRFDDGSKVGQRAGHPVTGPATVVMSCCASVWVGERCCRPSQPPRPSHADPTIERLKPSMLR
jgi:hypothetical protein